MRTTRQITAAALLLGFEWVQAQTLPPPPVSPAPVARYEYDAQGNATKTVQAPGVAGFDFATSASYDTLNRLKDATDARAGVVRHGYNGREDLIQLTDPRNLVTQYARNGLGDVTSLISPDTGVASSSFDAAGNLKTRTDSRGAVATYSWDALNRLTSAVYSQPGLTGVTHGWIYDQTGSGFSNGIGRLTTMAYPSGSVRLAYDALGRLASATQSASVGPDLQVAYQYDAAGRIVALTYPSGRKLGISYAGGQPTALSLAKDGASTPSTLISAIQWEPFGGFRSWQWQMASGTQAHERTYDGYGRVVRYRLGRLVRDVSWDAAERIVGYAHYDAATGSAVPGANQVFAYDELARLIGVSAASGNTAIAYDANGNRTGITFNGNPSAYATAATSNRLGAISNPARSLGYDAAGNVLSDAGSIRYVAEYDAANRLSALSSIVNGTALYNAGYQYNAQGQRVSKSVSKEALCTGTACPKAPVSYTVTRFVYDPQGRLLGEYQSDGAAVQEYVWLGDTPVAVIRADPGNAANPPLVYYIHADHLDTPRYVFDRSGNMRWSWDSEPFGTAAANEDPSGLGEFNFNSRFPGQYFDVESGLHYNMQRHYDPSIGRFVQSDPIGLAGGINTYSSVESNPLSGVDPQGLDVCRYFGLIVYCEKSDNAFYWLDQGLPPPVPTNKYIPERVPVPTIPASVLSAICSLSPQTFLICAAGAVATSFGTGVLPDVCEEAGDDRRDCKRASIAQLRAAGITSEHAFKSEWGAIPNSQFDICACNHYRRRLVRFEATMNVIIYFWADGASFDPRGFQRSLVIRAQGLVGPIFGVLRSLGLCGRRRGVRLSVDFVAFSRP